MRILLTLLAALAAGAVGAQSDDATPLAPGDEVRVEVAELPDVGRDVLTVREDGTIELPTLGRVTAAGLTPVELAGELRRRLEARGLRRATVDVAVVTRATAPVMVLGAAARPGAQTIAPGTRLLDVLLAAGGPTGETAGDVLVRRTAPNGLSAQVAIPLDALLGADPAVNLPLAPGDLVTVARAASITVHFLGEVASTGSRTFSSAERVTLLRAIASVGGLSATASNKIRIVREVDGERREIVANFKRILAGDDPDVPLLDGDIVIVKESFF